MKLQCLSCRGKLFHFVVTRRCKQKKPQPVNIFCMKVIMWFISSTYIFFNQIEIITTLKKTTLSAVQLNLGKVSVMCTFWHHTFYQVLFDMSKNRDVISQPVKLKKNINASCYSGVILEHTSSTL